MTTIILTILSIMVAAAATLILVYWGGDMFQDGTVAAQADAYMNAGQNVVAAADQFRMDNRRDPASFDALVQDGFLKQFPYTGRTQLVRAGEEVSVTISGIEEPACRRINEIQGRDPGDDAGTVGCEISTGTYHSVA